MYWTYYYDQFIRIYILCAQPYSNYYYIIMIEEDK